MPRTARYEPDGVVTGYSGAHLHRLDRLGKSFFAGNTNRNDSLVGKCFREFLGHGALLREAANVTSFTKLPKRWEATWVEQNTVERLEKHPAVRFGLPAAAIVGCTLLIMFGVSYFGSSYAYTAIGALLLLTGYLCGWGSLGVVVMLSLALIVTAGPSVTVPRVDWAVSAGGTPPSSVLYHRPEEPGPVQMRSEYALDDVIGDMDDAFGRVRALVGWVNGRWSHSSSNMPSSNDPLVILREAADGASFRCVEYSIVLVGAAQAMGMPARVVGLKTRWAETARAGAGHVVAEIWLDDLEKWIVADPQLGYVFKADGGPLNAVELGQALARGPGSVEVLTADGRVGWLQKNRYLVFMGPYLFYFGVQYDQRVFLPEEERVRGAMMLVPNGAPDLKVVQRQTPLDIDHYTSSLDAMYAGPETARW